MANLETLELTINGSADNASKGIDRLISSLSALSTAIVKPYSDLVDFNTELKKLKDLASSIKMPNLGKMTGGSAAAAKAKAKKRAEADYDPLTNNNRIAVNKGSPDAVPDDVWQKQYEANLAADRKMRRERMIRNQELRAMREANKGVADSYKNVASSVKEASPAVKEGADAINESGKEAKKSEGYFKKLGEQIKKIAKTMLIRTAIKALIKGFKEAFDSAYAFSKKVKGDFAKSIDSMKASLRTMSINIVRAFAPLASVIAPVISVVASGIRYLCDAIIELLRLLGVASEMFGSTASQISAVGQASSGTANDILASFDELNVLSSGKGGGSGSGSGGDIVSSFEEQIEQVKVIVGEALLAVGLILAFSGHVGVGLGLAAVGAAAIAGTIATKWGELSNNVKEEIATIMTVAGASMIALGLLFSLSGANIPLGIALMAVGAANMATAVTLSWNLSDTVKKKIAVITEAVSGGLLAIGALLAFSNADLPLGIGMMIAGAAGIAASVALTWDTDSRIKQVVTTITSVVGGALFALGAILTFTGANLPLGIGMMAAGAASLATAVALNWDSLTGKIREKIAEIMGIVGGALLAVGAILALTGVNMPLGIGMMALGGVSLAGAAVLNWDNLKTQVSNTFKSIGDNISKVWDGVKEKVNGAWESVKTWASATWNNFKTSWDNIKTGLVNEWNSVKTSVTNAWTPVKTWISSKWANLKTGWDGIKTNMVNVWNGIKTSVSNAWTKFSSWKTAKWNDIKAGWTGIKSNLTQTWSTIKTNVSNAWDKFKLWKTAKWNDLKTGWTNIKSNLSQTWSTIKTNINNAWEKFKSWKTAKWNDIKTGWTGIKSNLSQTWSTIKTNISNAWTKFKDWKNAKWDNLKSGWTSIKSNLSNAWSTVKNSVSKAWDSFKEWKNAKWDSIKAGWTGIQSNLGSTWATIKNKIGDAWDSFKNWKNAKWADIQAGWVGIQSNIGNLWSTIKTRVGEAWDKFTLWKSATWDNMSMAWNNIKDRLSTTWNDIKSVVSGAWNSVTDWFNTSIIQRFAQAWGGIATWFANNVTNPIKNAWNSAIDTVKSWINKVIDALNRVGTVKIPKIQIGSVVLLEGGTKYLWSIKHIEAEGDYKIPSGDVFLANDAGPEMVGRIGNHTSVANQDQIIEGIRRGVADGQAEQNQLLREQNKLLRGILAKETSFGPSSGLGRTVKQSLDMYAALTGG